MRQPRVLFLGGSGHHYLRPALSDVSKGLFVTDPDAPNAAEAMAERGGFAVHDARIGASWQRGLGQHRSG